MCQLTIKWMFNIKKCAVNEGCMSISSYKLENGRHLARNLGRRRAYVTTSDTASHNNHEKFKSRVSISFLYWSSAMNPASKGCIMMSSFISISYTVKLIELFLVTRLHCFRQFLFLICQTEIAFRQEVDTEPDCY